MIAQQSDTAREQPLTTGVSRFRLDRIIPIALILLTFALFWRVSQNGFVGYDDADYQEWSGSVDVYVLGPIPPADQIPALPTVDGTPEGTPK